MPVRDFEGKLLIVDGKKVKVPLFSKWEEKCSCCCCHIAYFPDIKSYFCNQWECHCMYPLLVLLLVYVSFGFGTYTIYDHFEFLPSIISYSIFSFTFLMWNIAYFCAMCRSPGYLPWFWAVEKGTQYTWEEHMDGVITTQEQYNFADANAKPERGSLTKQGRRLILRADHICPWIANWVGLKNYRYFFTKLLWTVLLFMEWYAIFGYLIYKLVKFGWKLRVSTLGMIICALPVFLFFIFFMVVFCRHCGYLCRNTTTLQELRAARDEDSMNPYDLGCCTNCSETLGPKYLCCCWFIPIPLPRLNAGIYWRRSDKTSTSKDIDYAAEVPRGHAIFASEDQKSNNHFIMDDEEAAEEEYMQLPPKSEYSVSPNYNNSNQNKQELPTRSAPKNTPEPPKLEAPKPQNNNNKSTSQNIPELPTRSASAQSKKQQDSQQKLSASNKTQYQSPKKEKLIGVDVDQLLDDTSESPRLPKRPKMRRYDPERDAGKKVYRKVHVAHKGDGSVVVSQVKRMPSPPRKDEILYP